LRSTRLSSLLKRKNGKNRKSKIEKYKTKKAKYKIIFAVASHIVASLIKLDMNSLNKWCVYYVMSRPDYPLFSKRIHREQRNKRGGYNFERSREFELAEKWFEERKGSQRTLIPVPEPPPKPASLPTKAKGPPPGLSKPVIEVAPAVTYTPPREDCDLELIIPSYDEFNYVDPDEIVVEPLIQTFDCSNIDLFEPHYSTPYIVEGELDEISEDEEDNYRGQLAEFEEQEALKQQTEFYNQFVLAYQIYANMMLMANTVQA
jgi:hypothetical protein